MNRLLAASLLLSCVFGALPARAQMDSREAIALQNQILELRRDMQQMRQQGGAASAPAPQSSGGGTVSGDLGPQLLDRIDESDNARQRQVDDLNKRIGDLEFRLNGAGGASPVAPPPLSPQPGKLSPSPGPLAAPSSAATAAPVRRTPETALQDGNAALARHDYAAAEASAREVLAGGRGPRTTDAQYLLAQALAGKRDYQGAAVAFDDAYTRNPKGSKAPESLLGLANSLTAINEKKAACQTLDKLRAEFPTLRGDVRSLAAAARQRASCG
jgi:TolA-binding protein